MHHNSKNDQLVLREETSLLKPITTSLLRGERVDLDPYKAWTEGTNIKFAIKHHPVETRHWIRLRVAALCKAMDAKKTVSTDEELNWTCQIILRDHPTLKLEEIDVCFDNIRAGKYGPIYERLKAPEILMYLRDYEAQDRCDVLERINNQDRQWESQLRKMPWEGRKAEFLKELDSEFPKDGVHTISDGIGTRMRRSWGGDKPNKTEQDGSK